MDTFTLFTDGGSRGNPGPAAAGVVLIDPRGHTVHAAGHFLGKATNNVAEYEAMLFGLQAAIEKGIRRLTVRSDSELMVRQINGQYKVKNAGIKPLHAEAIELIEQLEHVEVVHVRREHNVQADQLVNDSLDRQADVGGAVAGGAERGEDVGAGGWPPDRFVASCTADGFDACPAVVSAGGRWEFPGATPAGLCVHAAAGILSAVTDAKPGAAKIVARCVKPGCKASFDIRLGS